MLAMCVRVLLPLVAAAGAVSALEGDFEDLRLQLGICDGYTKEDTRAATLNGVADPGGNGRQSLSPITGVDFEPGAHLGQEIDGGFGLTFGMDLVLRGPGGTLDRTTDTGVVSGSGSGDVLQRDHLTIHAIEFGARFDAGVYQVLGPVRIELTPFLGVGAARMHFSQSRIYDNDPTNLLAGNDATASWSQTAPYWEYGCSVGAYLQPSLRWLLVGISGGFLATDTLVAGVQQHGAVFPAGNVHLTSLGWDLMGSVVWAF